MKKSRLDEDWETHSIIIKINRFLFIILQWKLLDTFLWYIYICCRLWQMNYYSFFAGLKTSFLFCRPGLTRNASRLFFFGPARWKIHFFFAGPARWKNCLSFNGSAHWKIISHSLVQTSTLEWFRINNHLYRR